MTYRNDNDALRARKDAAEQEARRLAEKLEETKRQLAAHEKKDVQDEKELRRLRKQVSKLADSATPIRPDVRARAVMIGIAVATTAGVGAFLVVQETGSEPAPSAAATGASSIAPETAARPSEAPAPAPPPPSPLDVAIFGAQITRGERAGEGCAVEADVAHGPELGRVRVFCGPTAIYDSEMDGGAGVTMSSATVHERTTAAGQRVYTVSSEDTGTRSGERPQLVLDAERHAARVWREGATPLDVRMFVDDRSAERSGEPLDPHALVESAIEPLHVRATRARARDACELNVQPATGTSSCRATLRCADEVAYGDDTTGYATCTPTTGTIATLDDARDDDGDPVLHVDLVAKSLDVGTLASPRRYVLDDDPRCSLAGTWSGRARTARGETTIRLAPRSIGLTTVRVNGRLVSQGGLEGPPELVASGLASGEAHIALDCRAGTGTIQLPGGAHFVGRFGPGFATFVGYATGEQQPAMFWLRREEQSNDAAAALPPEAREALRQLLP